MKLVLALLVIVAAVSALPLPPKAENGKQFALLVAGSNGWGNYRHQADIYHAYQILVKGGLDPANIVVMHYDDIANSMQNPHKGTVMNNPSGEDVYKGVPKDYTGRHVNKKNFLAALKGDASGVSGGSGKVINSGPNDDVFVYFADHGAPGILAMPDFLIFPSAVNAKDINQALRDKASKGGFRQLVFYVEACESGSIFEDQLPQNISVYATTAANGEESSWGVYCPGQTPAPPKEMNTCLGDLYSVSWMEDTDAHDRSAETLQAQYDRVKNRVSQNGTFTQGSHVQQFGELSLDSEDLSVFLGPSGPSVKNAVVPAKMGAVNQRDADLIPLYHAVENANSESTLYAAQTELNKELAFRKTLDNRMNLLANAVMGTSNGLDLNTLVRRPVVDDWDCYMDMFRAYEENCGAATQYGLKYGRLLANLCNAGKTPAQVAAHAKTICSAN